jgi:hypothetical protein
MRSRASGVAFPRDLPPKIRFEQLSAILPVACLYNKTRSDRVLVHIGTPLVSVFIRADTMMKRSTLPSTVRLAQALCGHRLPILNPIIQVGVELPRPCEKMQMIRHNDIRPDFPEGGFRPDSPQKMMVFVRRQPPGTAFCADGSKNQCGLMLFAQHTLVRPNPLWKWIDIHNLNICCIYISIEVKYLQEAMLGL